MASFGGQGDQPFQLRFDAAGMAVVETAGGAEEIVRANFMPYAFLEHLGRRRISTLAAA